MSDPISDMFVRIRNAVAVKHDFVDIPFSIVKLCLVKILREEGFIRYYEIVSHDLKKKSIRLALKYTQVGSSVIRSIRRVSKPGRRVYVKKREIGKVLDGFGISFYSTSKGIMTGWKARLNNVGGELIGEVS